MDNVSTKKNKDVRINLKTTEQLRREFQVAAELRGSTMSNLIHQFIVATIWDEKKKHPTAFEFEEEQRQASRGVSLKEGDLRTPVVTNSGVPMKPARRDRSNDLINNAFGSHGQKASKKDQEAMRKSLEDDDETPNK